MSDPIRLFVLFVDELAAKIWKPILVDAAHAGGWDLLGGTVENWSKMTDRCLILSDDPDWGIVVPAGQSAVIMTGPPQWEGHDLADPLEKDALALASARLAKASALIEAGAVPVRGQDKHFNLADLISVTRTSEPLGIPISRTSPLDIYKSLPPTSGAAAIWPAECLWYPVGEALDGGAPAMDLTGRARILFHGPHIYLTPGVWRATFQISVDPEGGVPPLRFEWKHGESAVVCDAPINQPGRYEISLERRWDVVGPSQIAGLINQAVFQGSLEVHDCKVELLSTDPA